MNLIDRIRYFSIQERKIDKELIMKIIKFSLVFSFLIILVHNAFAIETRFIIGQGESYDIKEPCFYNGTYCTDGICNLTVWQGNLLIVDNVLMTDKTSFHNYTLNSSQTNETGEYEGSITCCDGTKGCDFNTFTFEITPNGERPDIAKAMFYIGMIDFMFVVVGIFFYSMNKTETPVFKVFWFICIYLFGIAIIFTGWNFSADFLTSAPFITAFLRIVFLIVTFALIPIMFCMFLLGLYWLFWETEFRKLVEGRGLDELTAVDLLGRRKGSKLYRRMKGD